MTTQIRHTRIVLPDANGYTYENQILGHRIGDPVSFANTKDLNKPWHQGFSGYYVFDRHTIGDTVYLMLNH